MSNNSQQIASIVSNTYLNLALRFSLGVIFIISASSKMLDHTKFVEIVKEIDILPSSLATVYGNMLPWVELLIGVYLIFGILRRTSAFVVILMAVSFMVANINSLIDGVDYCGNCFGDAFPLTVKQAILLDSVIFIAALILMFPTKVKQMLTLESVICKTK